MKKTIEAWDEASITIHENFVYENDYEEVSYYDVVLCNLKLHDGWISHSIVQKIRRHAKRFIIVSGLADDSYYSLFSTTEYLLKPFNAHQLKSKIYS